jgi:hypothetical protein
LFEALINIIHQVTGIEAEPTYGPKILSRINKNPLEQSNCMIDSQSEKRHILFVVIKKRHVYPYVEQNSSGSGTGT